MPTPHLSPDPKQADRQQAEDAQYYREVLHGLIDVGANLARLVNEQAEADAASAAAEGSVLASAAPDASVAFERIARAVRRTIVLARHVAQPLPERAASHDASRQRTAARKRIIRSVEDTIEDEVFSPERAESLHAEMLERLDGPDVDDSLIDRPIGDIIHEIHRDLGLHAIVGMRSKRRTPADIAVLCARAAGERVPPTAARESVPPARDSAIRDRLPSAWTGRSRLASLAEADDAMLGDPDPADT